MNQKSAWFMQQRIRAAMLTEGELLRGIVEADETSIGAAPRTSSERDDCKPGPRGRAAGKSAVPGRAERGGRASMRGCPA